MGDAMRAGRSTRNSARERFRARETDDAYAPAADFASEDDDDFDPYSAYDEFGGYDDDGPDGFASLADGLIDDLVPPEVDWRRVVRRHPWPALLLAGLGGYLLGRSQGKTLVRAISALAVAKVESEVLGRIEQDAD